MDFNIDDEVLARAEQDAIDGHSGNAQEIIDKLRELKASVLADCRTGVQKAHPHTAPGLIDLIADDKFDIGYLIDCLCEDIALAFIGVPEQPKPKKEGKVLAFKTEEMRRKAVELRGEEE